MCGVFLLSKISFGKTDFNKARRILQIPSDTIRETLQSGDLALAEELLGRPYFIMGRVVYGADTRDRCRGGSFLFGPRSVA